MRIPPTFVALIALTTAWPASGQERAPVDFDRPDSFVAATGAFSFFSDPRINLHDLLVRQASSEEPVEPRPACLGRLAESRRRAYGTALAFYADELVGRDPEPRRLLLNLRYELAGFAEVELVPDSALAAPLRHLEAALPAYRACWWEDHDARNRGWIARAVPLAIAYEDTLAARLARLYHAEWPDRIPVDVAGYVNFGGANTIVSPHHILLSATDPSHRGEGALEILFHEASHTVVGPRPGGAITRAIAEASAAVDRTPPRRLWHAILFYTTGRVVQDLLAAHGVSDYEPYVYREGLFVRAWPEYREPLERAWEPYLQGRVAMEPAIRDVIASLPR